jgi:hypothetical protein
MDIAERPQTDGPPEEREGDPTSSARGRVLRIIVNEPGKSEVNIKVPLALARIGLKLGGLAAGEELKRRGIDLDELLQEVDTVGQIADITDDKAHVEIFVE